MLSRVIAKNVGGVFETQCRYIALHHLHVKAYRARGVSFRWAEFSVAVELLKISPDFLSKKYIKTDKETKFKRPNTSKINA